MFSFTFAESSSVQLQPRAVIPEQGADLQPELQFLEQTQFPEPPGVLDEGGKNHEHSGQASERPARSICSFTVVGFFFQSISKHYDDPPEKLNGRNYASDFFEKSGHAFESKDPNAPNLTS